MRPCRRRNWAMSSSDISAWDALRLGNQMRVSRALRFASTPPTSFPPHAHPLKKVEASVRTMAIASSPPHAYSSYYHHQPELSQPTTIAMTTGGMSVRKRGGNSQSPHSRLYLVHLLFSSRSPLREVDVAKATVRALSPHGHLRLSTSLKGKRKRERRWKGAEATLRALANEDSRRGRGDDMLGDNRERRRSVGCRPDLVPAEYANSPTSVGIKISDFGWDHPSEDSALASARSSAHLLRSAPAPWILHKGLVRGGDCPT
ncbi:hypothetical protein BHM03_00042746 [Ensete ventricosum]|nr:hypothetical protein BHM03_00042746 [Ensete ventricosum]